MPTTSPILVQLQRLHERLAADRSGAVADYIPELAAADPEPFGICLATVDGAVYAVGDSDLPFTIQSMSKPFVYGLALQDRGIDVTAARVGVEPSGDAFNAIALEPGTGRPRNPMVNAGAITSTSLVDGDRDARVLDGLSRYAGRPLAVDDAVFASEWGTAHRNRAIGHLLRGAGVLAEDPDRVVEAYVRQCAVRVTCRDVALMAATLANGGRQPLTEQQALAPALVDRVLSVMTTCGMYDGAGAWVVDVGMPAKSGVSGGVLAVLPGQFGLGVFSPRLDEVGNSVRGVAVCRALSAELGLHVLDGPRAGRAVVRASYDLAEMPSSRRRPPAERAHLQATGGTARVLRLQGDLNFAATERVVREALAVADARAIVVDLSAASPQAPSRPLIRELAAQLAAGGVRLALVDARRRVVVPAATGFPSLDEALQWAEDLLLDETADLTPTTAVTLEQHDIARGLEAAQLGALARRLQPRSFAAGEHVVRAGGTADELLLLMAGDLDVSVATPDGRRPLATLTPGAVLGEAALLGPAPRSADAHARSDVELLVLPLSEVERIADEDPALHAALLRALLLASHETVRRLSRQVGALDA